MSDHDNDSLMDKVKNAFGMGDDDQHRDTVDGEQSDLAAPTAGAGVAGGPVADPLIGRDDDRIGVADASGSSTVGTDFGTTGVGGEIDDSNRTDGWGGVDDALGGTGDRDLSGTGVAGGTGLGSAGIGSDDLGTRVDDSDRSSGWSGVDEALSGEENRPAGPDYGASDTDLSGTRRREEDL